MTPRWQTDNSFPTSAHPLVGVRSPVGFGTLAAARSPSRPASSRLGDGHAAHQPGWPLRFTIAGVCDWEGVEDDDDHVG